MYFSHTHTAGPGTATPVRSWEIQSSAVEHETGVTISRPDYRTDSWLDAPARSTVMAAMLANGRFPNLLFSTNMRDHVDVNLFQVPWWYRTVFTVNGPADTLLRVEGVIHKADLWVNGTQIADCEEIAGAYPVHTFDISELVVPGLNAIALLVYPGNAMENLAIGWVDWNPAPPDNNMGVWRDVVVLRAGDVRLAEAHVRTDVDVTSLDKAELTIAVDVHNASDEAQVVSLAGVVRGPRSEPLRFVTEETLAPGEKRRVRFTPTDTPVLSIDQPQLWWPVGQGGEQPLYELQLTATVDGAMSDQVVTSFGIRTVTSYLAPGGGRQFVVNGREIQILGGGWCPDLFLRSDYRRLVDEFTYTIELGLNTIRLEGKLENPEFYELADQLGVLVLPGWECCDKWEAHAGTGAAAWSESDYLIARRSMASEARLLRNHPSVLCFQIGSDFAPPPRVADIYVSELRAADWVLPIVSSGSSEFNNDWAGGVSELGTTATEAAGLSGMKMWPYDWVPPVYWYSQRYGGAVGFSSESSAGHSIPRLPSLRKMLRPEELDLLWQRPETHQYHAAPASPFDDLVVFSKALAGRYGKIASLRDFLRKSQLANYEMVRAQFEAYGGRARAQEPATGLIYWMLNTAWPSLNWHLYDYHLDPAGAYFGAKKANEPVHAQYSYDTGEILVVNHRHLDVGPFSLEVVVRALDGTKAVSVTREVGTIASGHAMNTGVIEVPESVTGTYFLELLLTDGDHVEVSRNVYWLSTSVDVVDWDATFWQYTPATQFADLKGLESLALSTVSGSGSSSREHGRGTTTITLRNMSTASVPAVGLHASIVSGPGASPVAPVLWDDNDITLFGGQEITLTARYSVAGLGVHEPRVEVDGFNLVPFTIITPAAISGH